MTQGVPAGKIIIPPNVYPEKHELEAANIFVVTGKDVEFIAPIGTKNSRSPDVVIDGVAWEIKCPTGRSKYTIQNQFKRAAKQSHNLILDTRRMKLPAKDIETETAKQFSLRRSITRLLLITKAGTVIEFR